MFVVIKNITFSVQCSSLFPANSSWAVQPSRLQREVPAIALAPSFSQACLIEFLHTWTASPSAVGMSLFTDVVSLRMCIQDTGPRPIRMWWEGLTRGRSEAHFSGP